MPATAQGLPEGMDTPEALITLAESAAAQEILELSGEDLVAILADATEAQLADLIAALSREDAQALVIALAEAQADPELLGALVAAIVQNDPEAANDVITAIVENAAPAVLPEIATNLFDKISGRCGGYEQDVLTGLTLATLSFSTATADSLVALGNRRGGDCAEALSVALAEISETSSDLIASAIETALALEGGLMAQLVSLARGEGNVAAIPEAGPAAAAPAAAPSAIGGGGATPGGGAPGVRAFAENAPGSGLGLAPGPAFTPAPTFTPLGGGGTSVSVTGG